MKTLPWSPSGVLFLGKNPRKMKWGRGGGQAPRSATSLLPPNLLCSQVGPQSRSPPPFRLMLGKIVSWHNGLEAKPNTLHIPRLCRWLALRGQVCCEPTGPQVCEGPSGSLEDGALDCVLGKSVNLGPYCFLGLSFPIYTTKGKNGLRALNSVPAVRARSKTTGRSPRKSTYK